MKRARYNKRCEKLTGFEAHKWTWGLGKAHSWMFFRRVGATWDGVRTERQAARVWLMFYND